MSSEFANILDNAIPVWYSSSMATRKKKRQISKLYRAVWLRPYVRSRLQRLQDEDSRSRPSDEVSWLIEQELARRKDGTDGGRLDSDTP